MAGTPGSPRIPRIALLLERLDYGDTYLDTMWKAFFRAANRERERMVIMVGMLVGIDYPTEHTQTAVYGLLDPAVFDGYIVCGTLLNLLDRPALDRFRADLPPIPGVSTTLRLRDLSSVTIDNQTGLRQVIRHLIRDHGKKRIVCIRGNEQNEEANLRFRVWEEETKAAGIHDPKLVIQGHFNPSYFPRLPEELIERTRGDFDAIVAPSDNVAAQVQNWLVQEGYGVPGAIAVTGFDNTKLCLYLSPTLTTVHQPIEDMVLTAMELLKERLEAAEPLPETHCQLPTMAVYRDSCGCSGQDRGRLSQLSAQHKYPWLNPEEREVEELLAAPNTSDRRIQAVRNAFATQHRQFWRLQQIQEHFNGFLRDLGLVTGIGDLNAILQSWMPTLGINRFAVSIAVSDTGDFTPCPIRANLIRGRIPATSARHRLIAADDRENGEADGVIFPSHHLAPPGWMDRPGCETLVALPLSVGTQWYGLALLEASAEGSMVFRSIQEHLSTILDREYRLATQVEQTIREQTRLRSEQEKTISLSLMVRSLAHEMNTPLGIGITSTSYLQKRLEELESAASGAQLSQRDFDQFIVDATGSLELTLNNLQRTINLISGFKDIGHIEALSATQEFDLVHELMAILSLEMPRIAAHAIKLEYVLPDKLLIHSRREVFLEIIQELLANSLAHAFPEQKTPIIRLGLIRSAAETGQVVLSWSDNGRGMIRDVLERAFDPFFTTDRANGHPGLGLTTVHSQIREMLGGTIKLYSELGRGTSITLVFPDHLA